MKIPIELETGCKKVRGLLIQTAPYYRDSFTGQGNAPEFHLVRDSLCVEILDDEAGCYLDVSTKYRADENLFKHCEKILTDEQLKKAG